MKKIVKLTFLLQILALGLHAQNVQNTPYSRFGIGELNAAFTPSLSAMGSVSAGVYNPYIVNYNNPASYAFGFRQRFIMQTGLSHITNEMKTAQATQRTNASNISHFVIGFPVSSWWGASIGILPYSSVSYAFSDTWQEPSANLNFQGSGGLNRFYIGNAFQLHKAISIGANINYLFGTLTTEREVLFADNALLHARENEQTSISGMYYDFGAMFKFKREAWTYAGSFTVDNGNEVSAERTLLSETFRLNNFIEVVEDTFVNRIEEGVLMLPKGFSVGFSLSNNKWLIAADYGIKNWSDFAIFGESDALENSSRLAFGVELTPDKKALNKYHKMIRYRVGAYTANTYLSLRNQQLQENVLSFGFGFPLRRSGSLLNISAEVGKRGTIEEGLIEDNFARFKLGLVLSDIWFIKRKFD